jgi:hypothetical protein
MTHFHQSSLFFSHGMVSILLPLQFLFITILLDATSMPFFERDIA